jgi:integrase
MPRLTKRFVDSLGPKAAGRTFFDDDLPGFGLRVRASGRRTYVVKYRALGRQRWMTLGLHGALTPEQARRRAARALAAASEGLDPAAERTAKARAGTVAELADRYITDHAEVRKKPASLRGDRYLLSRHVLPRLGSLALAALSPQDVAALHHAMRATPYAANRALRLLSKMLNLAERWGLRPDGTNPCRRVEPYAEEKRRRFLSGDELARLGAALEEAERFAAEPSDGTAVAAVRLLIFTGARAGEVLGLRWEWVDFERGCLRLPDSKTGAKEIPLGAAALDVLEALPRSGPWVIPGRDPRAPLVNLNKAWRRIRERAELPDVRLHDLRRTAASAGASVGLSLETVGQLLGHAQPATTKRYAFLFDDAKRKAANAMSARIAEGLRRKPARKVVPLRREG